MKVKSTNKAFTLIELLAVIVILAIIALIATPVILGIINSARESATERSAENYVKAVEQAVMRENLTAHFAPTTCQVAGTTLSCTGYEPIQVDVEGEKPTTGTITFANNRVDTYSLTYPGNKTVTKESSTTAAASSICTLEGTAQDPNKYTAGDKYLCKVDPDKAAYGFYVLNDTAKTADSVNLILEANIDPTTGDPIKDANPTNKGLVAWMSLTDWTAAGGEDLSHDDGSCELGGYCVNNTKGPITAMNALKTATDSWTNLTDMTVSGWNSDASTTNIGTLVTPYTLKARLPYYQELTTVGCAGDTNSCPTWLSNYLDTSLYVSQANLVSGVYGYWTSSANSSTSHFAWTVYCSGSVDVDIVDDDDLSGLRPVINVSSSRLSQ